jgi:hypothetical protein
MIATRGQLQKLAPLSSVMIDGKRSSANSLCFLSNEGAHSLVYLYSVEGREGRVVVKVDKDHISPPNTVLFAANRLLRYAQYKAHPVWRNHTAIHHNLEPHLKTAEQLLAIGDKVQRIQDAKDYVSKQADLGYTVVDYVPGDFPLDPVDSTNSCWKQQRDLFAALAAENCPPVDLRRDNTRINEHGVVMVVDILEEPNRPNPKELCRSFTDKPEGQQWLRPALAARPVSPF